MKRIISMLLVATFILTAIPATIVNASPKYTASFMTNLLYRLGCIDNETGIDGEITLSEFMNNANRLKGFNDETLTEGTDQIALIQAVRVLIDLLGYNVKLKSDNDYDYIVCAKEIGLLKSITKNQNDIITKQVAHTLLFNALTIKHLERTSFGSSETYEESERTFLKDVFNVRIISGIVEELQPNSSSANKDSVILSSDEYGKVKLYIGNLDIFNSIGMNVSVYVKLSDKNTGTITQDDIEGHDILTYVADTNDVLTIKKGDLLSYDSVNHKVHYKDSNNKLHDISTSSDIVPIYNGKVSTTNTTLNGSIAGFTRFIDNNNDGEYDYAVIWDYYELYVDVVYPESKTVRSKYNLSGRLLEISSGKNFKIDKDKFDFIIEKDGKRQDIKNIAKSDVLNIAVSEDKSFVKIMAYATKVEGAIVQTTLVNKSATELNLSDSTITIGEKDYKLSKDFYNNVKKSDGMLPYKLGDSGKFFLNFEGKIAYADIKLSVDKYAYLLKASAKTGISTKVEVKLLDCDNEWKVLELADKVSINDSSIKRSEIASKGYEGLFTNQNGDFEAVKQLIQYNITDDNKINTLRIAKIGYDTNIFSLDNDYTTVEKKYLSKGEKIGDAYITESTLVFNIDTSKALDDEKAYTVTNKSLFVDKKVTPVIVYDKDKDFYAAAIVSFGPAAEVNKQSKLSIVKSISSAINSKGEQKTKITFYENKEEKSLLLSDDVNSNDMKKGVAFQYSMKNSEEIGTVLITADLNAMPAYYIDGNMEVSDKYMVVYGKANVRTETIGVKTDVESKYKVDENTNVYQYDRSTQKTSIIELSSIENDSNVLVKVTSCKVTDIIKIK